MAAKACFRLPFLLLAVTLGLLSSPTAADEVLLTGQDLAPGQALTNCGRTLIMQTDCNLVLYDNGNAVWSSGTSGWGNGCRLKMQGDGNLVIYTNNGNSVWASNTRRDEGNYILVLQRDRNLVIYGGAFWSTNTNTYGARVAVTTGAQDAVKDETSAAAVVGVSAVAGEGDLGLGRKINTVTNKA